MAKRYAAAVARWKQQNPERVRSHAQSFRRRHAARLREGRLCSRYGLSVAQYEAKLAEQYGVCQACAKTPTENGEALACGS